MVPSSLIRVTGGAPLLLDNKAKFRNALGFVLDGFCSPRWGAGREATASAVGAVNAVLCMDMNWNRVQKGVPTGGQFSTGRRHESTVALDDRERAATIETMHASAENFSADANRFAQVAVYSRGSGALVEMCERVRSTCAGCGQGLGELNAAVTWVDERDGHVQGGFSHQHGCGTWNTPLSVSARVDLDDEPNPGAVFADLRKQLRPEVAGEVERLTAEAKAQVEADHAETLAALAAGETSTEDLHGSETEPGSYVSEDDRRLVTWAYVPVGGSHDESPDLVETSSPWPPA